MYMLEMTCTDCGSKAIAPCLPDKPGWKKDENYVTV